LGKTGSNRTTIKMALMTQSGLAPQAALVLEHLRLQ
jgi:hypothetical protein